MEANRSSQDFKVNVKVNAPPPEDLTKILAEIREDYEAIIETAKALTVGTKNW